MKIKSITNWQSTDKKENKILLWFYCSRKLTFKFFDDINSLKNYCKYYKITGIKKALLNYNN